VSSEQPFKPIGIEEIKAFLPHRAPFLLIDRVMDVRINQDPKNRIGIKVVARKNATYNEPFMAGHFPLRALTPGVLILESMAQTTIFSLYPYFKDIVDELPGNFETILSGVNNVRFRRPVVPGDTMHLTSTVTKCKSSIWVFDCTAEVDGVKVAEAELMASLVLSDKLKQRVQWN
jgi:3-hydroxyacyl-[acyl-carrier-protein] dehydratase